MAGFLVHAMTSFALSASASAYICAQRGLPLLWGGALCLLGFLGGLLPDVDSNETKIARYGSLMAGAGLSLMVTALFLPYIFAIILFFPFVKLANIGVQKWTTHRGAFHSIPMALLFAAIAFHLSQTLHLPSSFSFLCAGFLGGGYLFHLTLDELWSLRKGIDKHSSFGTALQVFRPIFWKSFLVTYALLAIAVFQSPQLRSWVQTNMKHLF